MAFNQNQVFSPDFFFEFASKGIHVTPREALKPQCHYPLRSHPQKLSSSNTITQRLAVFSYFSSSSFPINPSLLRYMKSATFFHRLLQMAMAVRAVGTCSVFRSTSSPPFYPFRFRLHHCGAFQGRSYPNLGIRFTVCRPDRFFLGHGGAQSCSVYSLVDSVMEEFNASRKRKRICVSTKQVFSSSIISFIGNQCMLFSLFGKQKFVFVNQLTRWLRSTQTGGYKRH